MSPPAIPAGAGRTALAFGSSAEKRPLVLSPLTAPSSLQLHAVTGRAWCGVSIVRRHSTPSARRAPTFLDQRRAPICWRRGRLQMRVSEARHCIRAALSAPACIRRRRAPAAKKGRRALSIGTEAGRSHQGRHWCRIPVGFALGAYMGQFVKDLHTGYAAGRKLNRTCSFLDSGERTERTLKLR